VGRLSIGIASIPLALFISHVSTLVIDFPWGVYAAVVLAVIGYGLVLTAQPIRRHVWSGLAKTHPIDIALATALVTGALIGSGAWFFLKQEEARLRRNLVPNGGFETGTDFWGAGSRGAATHGTLDTTDRHSGGAAYRFDHDGEKAEDQWGSLSQRITRLRPRTSYAATFWALVEQAESRPLFLTADQQGTDRTYVENVIAGWREYRLVFNTGDSDHIDLRFVIEAPGTVWIDDVSIHELKRERQERK
jgi:Carbohydrate binding domain